MCIFAALARVEEVVCSVGVGGDRVVELDREGIGDFADFSVRQSNLYGSIPK
ncbi:MAG: hypothetical protein SW833_21345 [Cyanobacteriota bacterium]|nr:hypothetical protein [Cyanobacteriota bacterium]